MFSNLALNAAGDPLRPWGTGEQQRYAACINNPGWRTYSHNAIRLLIQAGVAGIFYDDAFPLACDCPRCQAGFRKYLASRYTPAELTALEARIRFWDGVHQAVLASRHQ